MQSVESGLRLYGWGGACLGCGEQIIDQAVKIEADDFGDVDEFDDVDASAPALDRRNDGLVAFETTGELSLAEARTVALLYQEFDEAYLPRAAKCFGHEPASASMFEPTHRVISISGFQKIWLCPANGRG